MCIARKIFAVLSALILLVGVYSPVAASDGITPADGSEFTILWTTDPQWYSFKYNEILIDQNDWVVENYDRMNMQYIIHTGDFVDLPHNKDQWSFIDSQYKKWDDAGLAYGVLAGNHDVDGTDYTEFKQYFGTHRFSGKEWYGESYDGNRGHYDLMTLGGVDFIFVYLGYGAHTESDYEWMNGVLSQHGDRIAFLMFHEYLNADGTRTAVGDNIFNNVVLKNPNVRMVLCGHNYNSARLVEYVDDNGDGKDDRTVYQLMANYQNTPNGGNGYMRFLEFDVDGGKIIQRTYSPYLNKFNMFENRGDESDEFGYRDEFTLPFDFSAPLPKNENDPVSGKTVLKPRVNIAGISLPVSYVNDFEEGEKYDNVGIYDINFSFDARDALSSYKNAKYITVEYKDKIGWTVCGIFENGNKAVSIPQNGRAIVISQDATDSSGKAFDLSAVSIADPVCFSQIGKTAGIKAAAQTRIRFKGLNGSFAIDGVNSKVGNGNWVVFDRDCDESVLNKATGNKHNVVIVFAPCGDGRYAVTEIFNGSAEAKNAIIPEKGFALVINTAYSTSYFKKSIDKTFFIGKQAMIYGFEPETGFVLKGESIISNDPADWKAPSPTLKLETTEGGLTMWNTDGLWPDMRYVYSEALVVDPKESLICYDFYMEQSSQASFVVQLVNGKYFKLNSYFENASISSGSGDVKGEGKSLVGTVDLSVIEMDPSCLNSDGTLSIKSLQIYVSGDAGKKITLYEMRLIEANDIEDFVPEDFLVPDEDVSSDTSHLTDVSSEASDETDAIQESDDNGTVLITVCIVIAVAAVTAIALIICKKKKG
ncbi:MAG: hypothetical protein IIW39_02990 [Clostridia bacterium]|nr:hypothetical protein [Clostridia bacterium]